jgi:N-acetylmuramoyl-L-alanine amidase
LAKVAGAQVVLDEATGVHHVSLGGRHVAVVGGVRWAVIGSEARRLDHEVVVRYGRAYVPRSAARSIESYLRGGRGGTRVTPRPVPPQPVPGVTGHVVVDAGHGGKDPGARSRWGLVEKDVVLDSAKLLAEELRALGFTVTLTRTSDVFLELDDRPAVANRLDADIFVSVHANAISRSAIRGMEIFYWDGRLGGTATKRDRIESDKLARCIERACEADGLTVRSVRGAAYRVLRYATMPAVLVELGFLTNYAEERLLRTQSYRRKLARAVAQGIKAYRTP